LVRGRAFFYSAAGRREAAVFADGPQVVFRVTGREERLDLASRLRLLGRHNLANVLAAATAARALGVGLDEIGDAVGALRPLPHRLEPIGKRESVLFVDDSKATTPVAARAAIEAFSQPAGPGRAKGTAGVILIAGGYDKKTDPAPMVAAARERAKAVLVIGQTGPALAAALDGGRARVERAGDLEAAVRRAVELAAPGDVVLLAPGHASWDMFDNYEQRGKAFRRAAEACGMQPLAP
jgi:UDP-N-acetylmuramoylalanine--D-glutamate ligase